MPADVVVLAAVRRARECSETDPGLPVVITAHAGGVHLLLGDAVDGVELWMTPKQVAELVGQLQAAASVAGRGR